MANGVQVTVTVNASGSYTYSVLNGTLTGTRINKISVFKKKSH